MPARTHKLNIAVINAHASISEFKFTCVSDADDKFWLGISWPAKLTAES